MKRLPFILTIITLTVILVAAEMLLSRRRTALAVSVSTTPTPVFAGAETQISFENFPTHVVLAVSPTSIPLQATRTYAASETPALLTTSTLLPINTSTLLPLTTPLTVFPSQTPVFFASATATPFGGSATPPVPVAYSSDGKAKPCYKGPSLAYVQTDTFAVARISGKDSSGRWWYLLVFKGQGLSISCWAADRQVITAGDLSGLSVVEPELPQITQVKVTAPGALDANGDYPVKIICDDGASDATLHFSGQIFSNGPLKDIGYRWSTDAPVSFKAEHGPIRSWDAPAETSLDLTIPSQAATYSLMLRTTYPMEIVGGLQVIVSCR